MALGAIVSSHNHECHSRSQYRYGPPELRYSYRSYNNPTAEPHQHLRRWISTHAFSIESLKPS
ncbi:hypothetical protein M378DRAFT_165554 [Amanita muscaria Koide BX008]|uniref:Uncharacterized protein n=1 Tax=Amanita muscaria (strain Koide BX008) TaxID=946122 RepID=A0A0C2WLU9_AMAMK|nr:hypothetical protein M378DRAFT_165554 [Amanita muscaria Koide BX008]